MPDGRETTVSLKQLAPKGVDPGLESTNCPEIKQINIPDITHKQTASANDFNVTEMESQPNNNIPNTNENNVRNKQSNDVTDLRRSARIRREPIKLDL